MTPRQRIEGTVLRTSLRGDYAVMCIELEPDKDADIDSIFTWTLRERVTVVRNEPQ